MLSRPLAIRFYVPVALVAMGLAMAPAAAQPTPTRTPEDIIKALGTPASAPAAAEDEDDGSIAVGPQKAFSLATPGRKSAAPAVSARLPSSMTASRATPARSAAPFTRRAAPATAPSPLDMRVSFELGSAEMTEQAKAEARVFAQALQAPALAGSRFEVAGHTDAQGDRNYNLELSRRRAQSVVDFLVAQGADGSRLIANGYGFDKPLPGASPASPSNRRVEFSRAN